MPVPSLAQLAADVVLKPLPEEELDPFVLDTIKKNVSIYSLLTKTNLFDIVEFDRRFATRDDFPNEIMKIMRRFSFFGPTVDGSEILIPGKVSSRLLLVFIYHGVGEREDLLFGRQVMYGFALADYLDENPDSLPEQVIEETRKQYFPRRDKKKRRKLLGGGGVPIGLSSAFHLTE
jgi:hypothetical protein